MKQHILTMKTDRGENKKIYDQKSADLLIHLLNYMESSGFFIELNCRNKDMRLVRKLAKIYITEHNKIMKELIKLNVLQELHNSISIHDTRLQIIFSNGHKMGMVFNKRK